MLLTELLVAMDRLIGKKTVNANLRPTCWDKYFLLG